MNKRYFCGNDRYALEKMPLTASAYFATSVMLAEMQIDSCSVGSVISVPSNLEIQYSG
jgi:hypothetical protein